MYVQAFCYESYGWRWQGHMLVYLNVVGGRDSKKGKDLNVVLKIYGHPAACNDTRGQGTTQYARHDGDCENGMMSI